ncbi:MAG: GDSL-type esterase/lipase family protein [Planctomycetota bacterium]
MFLAALLPLLPLFPAPQTPEPAQVAPSHKKVLMIGIDGVRPDALVAAKTPHLDLLAQNGSLSLQARTTKITSSGPAWSSILTGARMELHGIRDNSFEGSAVDAWPTWLERLEKEHPESFTAAVVQWAPIHEHLTSGRIDLSMPADSGAAVTEGAVELLQGEAQDLTALFLHYDDVDHAGHDKGYGVEIPEYLAAIEKVDAEIGEVLEALRGRRDLMFEDWLIMVGTDHGGEGTSHGADTPACRTVFQLASGTGAADFQWPAAPEVFDFAAMALLHLGIDHATSPVPRFDGWWTWRQSVLNDRGEKGVDARVVFLGDSITQGWEDAGKEVWAEQYAPLKAVNLGIGGDRTQHVLWRLRNGNLKNLNPEVAVLMIGTNNSNEDSSDEISLGTQAVVAELLERLPEADVLMLATFPRGADKEDALRKINEASNLQLQEWCKGRDRVHWLDLGPALLEEDGTLLQSIMPDLLHLSPAGYRIWADAMTPKLTELLQQD